MADLLEYKCPCCGGAINFDTSIQKMKCPYCDTEFEMDALKNYDSELKNEQPDEIQWNSHASEWAEGETSGLRSYVCKSCGGEIVGDENTAATSCPYCDNPIVMTGQFSGKLKPDYIIPFKLDKKAAKEGLKQHLSTKKLLPSVFKSENHINEIKGIYVPFWIYDTDVDADIRYKGTKIKVWSDSNYDYEDISYYAISRSGSVGFEHVPVDASSNIDNELTESVEPFDFKDVKEFQTAYLAGYLADKYDVESNDSIERANKRIKKSTEEAFLDTIEGYTDVEPEYSSIRLSNGKSSYAMYPIWLLNTTWNGEKYTFAMNGQTGKFVGNLPVDKNAAFKMGLKTTLISGAIVYVLMWILWFIGIL